MSALLDRFLRYVKIDTQSDELADTYPSTPGQLELSRLLAGECESLGLADVVLNEHGIVTATVPATVRKPTPTIAWLAHVDTSPEYSGKDVDPVVHRGYAGGDIVLPRDSGQVIRVDENPALRTLIGGTLVTTDGTTLLGADDKAGVAVIMSAAARLMANRQIEHGRIRICLTCDEEIGRGIDKLDLEQLAADVAYTLDGDGAGKVDCETFSADLAVVTVTGVNTHPSVGKGVMVNAIRILSEFLTRLPADRLSPETTDGRDGFLHPYVVEGGVAQAAARIILRDFETDRLAEYHNLLAGIAGELQQAEPRCRIGVDVRKQYRNMRDGLVTEPRAVDLALAAVQAAGLKPQKTIIRGGTDGSQLTESGLPCPNLSTGEHNPHSPLEWTSLEEMQHAVDVLVQLAVLWGREST